MWMHHVVFILFSPNEQHGREGGEAGEAGAVPDLLFCSLFAVQQTTSGIGYPV